MSELEPTLTEVQAVLAKLREDQWRDFTERETEVAKWIVGWHDAEEHMDAQEVSDAST